MVLPFRLPNWRPGYYLATASFLLLNQTVRTELLQSTDHGLHWKQIAPGSEFIPLGPEGAFDSYTTCVHGRRSLIPLPTLLLRPLLILLLRRALLSPASLRLSRTIRLDLDLTRTAT